VIGATRRQAMMGALAVPTLAGMPQWRWQHGEASVLLHDPHLPLGRRFADAGHAQGGQVVELAGDRIRLARTVFAARPALVAGVSLSADALLVEEVGREHGYGRVALLDGSADSCGMLECSLGWTALGRMAEAAADSWVDALASYAVRPGQAAAMPIPQAQASVAGAALGWILVPRG
jgi:hypothetical protein